MAARPPLSCDIFCRVVDNFGDIGVTLRLARQLADEHLVSVRLIVDDLVSLKKIAPGLPDTSPGASLQRLGNIGIVHWPFAQNLSPADIVIEAFQCELPAGYVERMAQRPQVLVWLNLEYLSAETWVSAHHLLPSPHPKFPLTKYFFFPGFEANTGGLIRESGVQPAVEPAVEPVFEAVIEATSEPVPSAQPTALRVFVFGYDSPRAVALLETLAVTASVSGITIAEGVLADIAEHVAKDSHLSSSKFTIVPFVPQTAFDGLLAAHDILFVRGEDSLVRALYAAKPFVWQIYPQSDGAHLIKLEAFLTFYGRGLSVACQRALRAMSLAINDGTGEGIVVAWQEMLKHLPEWQRHAIKRQKQLVSQPDLATNMMTFCQKFLKI